MTNYLLDPLPLVSHPFFYGPLVLFGIGVLLSGFKCRGTIIPIGVITVTTAASFGMFTFKVLFGSSTEIPFFSIATIFAAVASMALLIALLPLYMWLRKMGW